MASTEVTVPANVVYCRGTKCDKLGACGNAGSCLYRSSADEAREVRDARFAEDMRAARSLIDAQPVPADLGVYVAGRLAQIEMFPEPDLDPKPSAQVLPAVPQERKGMPMVRGLLDYFPNALAYVSMVSAGGNAQHNLGHEMHWARGKSTDHADCIARHLIDRGTFDTDNLRHSGKVAWRALALLEEELEAEGAKPGRASRFPK